jgi:hypothetical protein
MNTNQKTKLVANEGVDMNAAGTLSPEAKRKRDIEVCYPLFNVVEELHRELDGRSIRQQPVRTALALAVTNIPAPVSCNVRARESSKSMVNWQGNSRIKASHIVTKASGTKQFGTKPSGNPDFSVILDTICSCTTKEHALTIAECLYEGCMTRNTRIFGLRACVVYALTGNDSWTIVQWREDLEIDVVAIFIVENETSPCNYLMHFGLRNRSQMQPGSKYWKESTLSWKVTSIIHLQELFKGAQHILGMLGWSRTDLLRVYCKDGTQTHLAEGYTFADVRLL